MIRPWEIAAGTRVFEAPQTVYPRTISVYRRPLVSASVAASGPLSYQEAQTVSGVLVWDTTPVHTGIPCSIQEETRGQQSKVDLPGSQLVPFFRIFIPFGALANGSLLVHDFVLDDLGVKYQISDPYWDSLGFRALAIVLEA